MDLYEHQGKDLFKQAGIPLVEGFVAESKEEARRIAERLGGKVAVKVQVQIGGRGKAGGIALVTSPDEAAEAAERMLSEGFSGTPVNRVLIERLVDIAEQFYAAITLDRSSQRYLAIVSADGGMDIEQVAKEKPEALRRMTIDPMMDLKDFQVRYLVGHLPPEAREGTADVLRRAYGLVCSADATLVEINPLSMLKGGVVVALDAKVTIDDNALYRQPALAELRSSFPVDPTQARANEKGLQYVKLDGEVGIIGNGAGLVMSTLDVVTQAGGKPANFLDVGGGASADSMATSLEVVLSDPAVRSVLVNIFGGITRGELVARGILEALKRVDAEVPIVVRLDGTNAEEGREILAAASHPRIVPASTMLEAAQKAVELAHAGGHVEMPILIDEETRLVVQGITGKEGSFHALRNKAYGTNVVAGVTPGKSGQSVEGVPVFDTVAEAVQETGANTSLIFVPARFAADAILEAASAGTSLGVCITEGMPVQDMARVVNYLHGKDFVLIGPNCPGLISPGKANVGIIPGEICSPGPVGLISRSGTLTYQIVHELTQGGVGPVHVRGHGRATPFTGSGSSKRWSVSRPTRRPGPWC